MTFLNSLKSKWLPPPKLLISDWADEYRFLSAESAAEPGKWSCSRVPYQRGFMDAIFEESIEQVVLMTSSQVGKTEALNNILGYFIHLDPCPILLIQPTLQLAEAYSKDRLAPMRRDCPVLEERIKDPRARASGNEVLYKSFPGGYIAIAGANSAASLASRPIRILLCDEVDRYPASAGTEGDPISLAKKRTTTFWNRKIILVSTPTLSGVSRIEKAYNESDKRKYLVPCPHCGEMQELVWDRVRIDKYACRECDREIEHRYKDWMLSSGQWRKSQNSITAGFAINELYSPWSSWADVSADFEAAKGDLERLQVWTNTSLGLPFEKVLGDRTDWEKLAERAAGSSYCVGDVPDGVKVLTAGVDVQGDRLEVSVWGWGNFQESWSIDHQQILGNPAEDMAWELLEKFLDGYGVKAVCIDSGYLTQEVYGQVRSRKKKRWFAVKGAAGQRPLVARPTYQEINWRGKVLKRGIQLYVLGVDLAKSMLMARSKIEAIGPKYQHYPSDLGADWFEGFCSEVQVKKHKAGVPYYAWEKLSSKRNEVLDCAVYALCAAYCAGALSGKNNTRSSGEDTGLPSSESSSLESSRTAKKGESNSPPASSSDEDAESAATADSLVVRKVNEVQAIDKVSRQQPLKQKVKNNWINKW